MVFHFLILHEYSNNVIERPAAWFVRIMPLHFFFCLSEIVEMFQILLFQILLRACLKSWLSDLVCLPVLVSKLNLEPCHLGLSIRNALSRWQAKSYHVKQLHPSPKYSPSSCSIARYISELNCYCNLSPFRVAKKLN